MKGWSAFTKGDGPLYKKEDTHTDSDGIKYTRSPNTKLEDPSLDPKMREIVHGPFEEGSTTVAKNVIEGGSMLDNIPVEDRPPFNPGYSPGVDEGVDILKDRVEGGADIRDIDVVDVLADDDAEMEDAEEVTPELVDKEPVEADEEDVADVAAEAAAAGAVVGGGAAKGAFPEFTGEVKDKGRWRQRRQRRKELRDAGMSRKEARIQARKDIGKKWGKHKA